MTFIPTVTANISVGNSTTSSLAPNGTFPGSAEDVSQYSSVSISYYVQPPTATGNIFVQFSNVASPFYPVSNTVTPVTSLTANGFTLDTTLTSQFCKVSYVNDSTNQTNFMIQTIYHPQSRIAVKSDRLAVPMNNYSDLINTRSIMGAQTQGNNPTVEILGSNGNQSLNVCINDPRTAYNEISVAQTYPLAQIDFVYGIPTTITSSNTFSNATVTVSSGLLKVMSNAAVAPSASIFNAKKFVKYRPGQGAQGRMTAMFSQPARVNGSIAVAGLGFAIANTTYPIDFCGFGYGNVSSCGQFGILWRRNGSDSFIPQTSWNLDAVDGTTKSGLKLNPQSLNSWQIQFQYCGNILFYLENPYTGRFILVHSIPTNLLAATVPNFQNPTLQLMWYSNSVSTSSNTLSVFGASGGHFLEGIRNLTGPRGSIVSAPSSNLVINTETMIFALKNSKYYGVTQPLVIPNRSQIHLRALTVSAAGDAYTSKGSTDTYFSPAPAIVVFKQIRAPTNAPSVWTPYAGGTNLSGTDGSNVYGVSTLSSNVSQLTNLTGGSTGFTITIPCSSGTSIIDLEPYEAVLYPEDVICWTANVITQFSTSNVIVAASLTWQEDL